MNHVTCAIQEAATATRGRGFFAQGPLSVRKEQCALNVRAEECWRWSRGASDNATADIIVGSEHENLIEITQWHIIDQRIR